ncbi:MAG TPA: hypothetical protein VK464_09215 [Symbiobacteriaceae bacterium]|nr:hypothetical protein [Symbiobacteriaceae bacterium]
MKAVPPKVLALGLAGLLCAAALLLLGSRRCPPGARDLQVSSVAEWTAAGQVELSVAWHWNAGEARAGWREGEELLAVSWDTQSLVWLDEEAPEGLGARGDTLRRLDQAAGPDGARRLFPIPAGRDGYVRLRFLPKTPQGPGHGQAQPFRVYVVYESPSRQIARYEQDF